ncbi:hypothetical protein ACFSJU_07755 [Paradesertivirga mongoliensis]|uniref:Uncharacterized protein n=1 Tax=Paradesertivirga mongoliensis TaxID=2100740 RepID=A0ABW4ZK88_9SPHI|nr:hypothetical protein [Pedobacter mongoliensis]
MFTSLTYHTKNRILLAGALILALLSWNLAFRKTYDAMSLNSELVSKVEQKNDLSVNPDYLNRKQQVLNQVVRQYTLDSAEWSSDFWLKVSKAAALKDVSVNYNPSATKALSDSASQIAKQDIAFKGEFKKLVTLLDSLERMKGAGLVASSKFVKEKKLNMAQSESLYLRTSFAIIQEREK